MFGRQISGGPSGPRWVRGTTLATGDQAAVTWGMKWLFSFYFLGCCPLFAKDRINDTDRMQPGYVISIQIVEDKRQAVQQHVSVTGEIQMPYIGLMKAAGKTCLELADEARNKLEPAFFKEATVKVRIDEKRKMVRRPICPGPPCVTVFGNVHRAGKYDLPDKDQTVSALLARAGGSKSGEKTPKIRIVRTTPQGEKIIVVNTQAILAQKKAEYDLILRVNDVMIVE